MTVIDDTAPQPIDVAPQTAIVGGPLTGPLTGIDTAPILPIAPGYVMVLRLQYLINVALVVGALCAADWLLMADAGGTWGILSSFAIAIGAYVVTVVPARQYLRWGYTLGIDSLRVVRGYVFYTDTVVPFVRVQHIDVGQGPIERIKGLSHLVVHTAGTHNSIVTLPGLLPDDAAAMRDTIRAHIISDFA